MSNKKLLEVLNILETDYPKVKCGLDFTNSLGLTVSLILAAQCTDKRVNYIAPKVFEKYPYVFSLAKANIKDLEKIIYSCGFYKSKAKNILATANMLVNTYGGSVPKTMDELTTLHGIGRKSANILLQECFNTVIGIAVDTHVTRLSNRIGFTKSLNPIVIERDLMKVVPKRLWNHIISVCFSFFDIS